MNCIFSIPCGIDIWFGVGSVILYCTQCMGPSLAKNGKSPNDLYFFFEQEPNKILIWFENSCA